MTGDILKVTIIGTAPLLMNSPAQMSEPKTTRKQTVYDPMEEATKLLYKNKEGLLCIPGFNLLACIRKASTEFKAPGRGRKTLKDFVWSGLKITEDMIPLDNQEWEIDARTVVMQRSRVMKWRPKFNKWSCTFHVEIKNNSVWEPGVIKEVIINAGEFIGVLDFRPLFGTFVVDSVYNETKGKEVK